MSDPRQDIAKLDPQAQLQLLASLVRRLADEWSDHAVIIRRDDKRGADAFWDASSELARALERYFPHAVTGSEKGTVSKADWFDEDDDDWQVDVIIRDLLESLGLRSGQDRPSPGQPGIGSSFDEFLEDAGIREEVERTARERLETISRGKQGPP